MDDREHRFYSLALILAMMRLNEQQMIILLQSCFCSNSLRKIAKDEEMSHQRISRVKIEAVKKVKKNSIFLLRSRKKSLYLYQRTKTE